MLTQDEVKHIAALARIGVTDVERERYQKDLSRVLDFFHELQALNTDMIEPIGHITGRVNVTRADETGIGNAMEQELIRKNFPDAKDGFLKVKSVL